MAVAAVGLGLALAPIATSVDAASAPVAAADDQQEPVEPDMHEFMEYVFEPTFKDLKAVMESESKDNSDWKTVKSGSLILAESANLILLRGQKDEDDWVNHAVSARKAGADLYQAAKKKDDAAASKSFEAMVKNCNDCHTQYAGEKQISID